MSVSRIALTLSLTLAGATAAQATIVSFTNSTLSGASSVLRDSSPVYPGTNLCSGQGTCATSLTYNTGAGKLTVTAEDGADFDKLALVNHSAHNNAGLGVVTGKVVLGSFHVVDTDYSLNQHKETLTLSFDNKVSLSQLFFFPNDRASHTLSSELDVWDGFTLSVDGGKFVEYSFGSQGGQPVNFAQPLVGSKFTFGYASLKSPEAYYLAGLNVAKVTPAVPEASSFAMLGLGLLAVAGVAARRRQQG